jgi:hypothetical protein
MERLWPAIDRTGAFPCVGDKAVQKETQNAFIRFSRHCLKTRLHFTSLELTHKNQTFSAMSA